jgi:hypothetical protein
MTAVYIILGLVLLCGILVLVCVIQGRRAAKAEKEAASLHGAFWEVQRKAEALQKTLGKQREAEVKADEERQGLAGTANSDLVHRANGLFGVPDKPGTGASGGNQV